MTQPKKMEPAQPPRHTDATAAALFPVSFALFQTFPRAMPSLDPKIRESDLALAHIFASFYPTK
jgi:hypothetical protein